MFEFLELIKSVNLVELIGLLNSPNEYGYQPMILPFAILIPAVTAAIGLYQNYRAGKDAQDAQDDYYEQSQIDAQQNVQAQQEAARYNVSTPYGTSRWDEDGNLIKEHSEQMQDMMDRKFNYRNAALDNAASWFGSPNAPASNFDTQPAEASYDKPSAGEDPNSGQSNTGFPGSVGNGATTDEIIAWGEQMGWGDDPNKWGDGQVGIPWWIVEKGQFPTNLSPEAMQSWWQQQQQRELDIPMDTP